MTKLLTSRAVAVSFGTPIKACIEGLAAQYGMTVLQAASAEAVFESIRRLRPPLVVLGVRRPESEATRLIGMLAGALPSVPIAVVGTEPEEEVERAALQAGARFYLTCSGGRCYREALESILSRYDTP
jgi:DNA-binding NarL/FixJ family response regulator